MTRSTTLFAALLASAAAIGFAFNTTAAKVAYAGGTNPLSYLTLRSAMAALLVLTILLIARRGLRLPLRQRLAAFGIGALLALYSYGVLSSIQFIPVALTILIFYTFPLLTSLYMWASGRAQPTWATGGALIVAFVGLALALDVTGGKLSFAGIALAAMAALGITAVIVLNNRVVGEGDSRPVTLHMMVSATTIFAAITWIAGDFALPTTASSWAAFSLGPLAYAGAIVTIFIAMSLAGPVPTSLSMNLEPVASMLFGFLALGEILSPVQLVGAGLVIAAVLSVRLADARRTANAGEESQ
jgi:drug/metabolite transporter (DMT)-like permease